MAQQLALLFQRVEIRVTMGDTFSMTKGTERRTTRLSVRVPEALKAALEREAVRDRRTLADVVIFMLEDALAKRAKKTKKGGRRG